MLPKQGREKYQFGRVREYIMTWYVAPTVWDGFLAKRSVWASQVMRWDSLTLELYVHWQYCCRTSTNQIAHHRYVFFCYEWHTSTFLNWNWTGVCRNRTEKISFRPMAKRFDCPLLIMCGQGRLCHFSFMKVNFVTSQTLFFSEQS